VTVTFKNKVETDTQRQNIAWNSGKQGSFSPPSLSSSKIIKGGRGDIAWLVHHYFPKIKCPRLYSYTITLSQHKNPTANLTFQVISHLPHFFLYDHLFFFFYFFVLNFLFFSHFELFIFLILFSY